MIAVDCESRRTHASLARTLLPRVAPAICLALAGACSAPATPDAAARRDRSAAAEVFARFLALSPDPLAFPDTPVSSLSKSLDVAINAQGGSPITVTSYVLGGDVTSFHVSTERLFPFTLNPGETALLHVVFHPQQAGARAATLTVQSDANAPSVGLTGFGQQGSLVIRHPAPPDGGVGDTVGRIDYGRELINTTSTPVALVVTNEGTAPLTITGASDGSDPEQAFVLSLGQTPLPLVAPITLNPGDTLPFTVAFKPPTRGVKAGIVGFNTDLCAPAILVTGQGTYLTADPQGTDFGAVQVGSTNYGNVFLNNSGDDGLALTGAEITCPDPACTGSPFSLQGTLTGTVYSNYGWADQVTFNPQAEMQYPGYAVVFHTEIGDVTAPLTGSGALPHLQISPATFAFADQDVRLGRGGWQTTTLTITNTGQLGASFSSVGLDDPNNHDFREIDEVPPLGISPAPVEGQSLVRITVAFTPQGQGLRTGNFAVTFPDGSAPLVVMLSGNGIGPVPTVSPSSLAFDPVPIGDASAPLTVTVGNTGALDLNISSVTISPTGSAFVYQGNQTSTVAGGGESSVSGGVIFQPLAVGANSATLTFHTDGGDVSVALSGTGQPGQVLADPALGLAFGDQRVGTQSASQRVTLSNHARLLITSVTTTAGFAVVGDDNEGQTPFHVDVAFAPTARGPQSGSLVVAYAGGSLSVPLTGRGLGPVFGVAPAAVAFGAVPVGDTSADRTLTLANSGEVDFKVTAIALDTPGLGFAFSGPATPFAVGAGSDGLRRALAVKFTPAALGAVSANLVLTTDAGTFPILLSGTGIAQRFSFAPSPQAFGPVVTGTNATSTVVVGNLGADPVTITAFTSGGADAQAFSAAPATGTLPLTIAGGASAPITVTFAAGPVGLRAGTLSLVSDDVAPGAPLALTAESVGPDLSLQPTSLDFGAPAVGTTSDPRIVTLKNAGKAPLTISAIGLLGGSAGRFAFTPPFTQSLVLAPGATAPISVTYHPSAVALDQATLHVVSDGVVVSSGDVSLSGQGTAPNLSATPLVLAFPPTRVGTLAQPLAVLITNGGGQAGAVGAVSISGSAKDDFAPLAQPTPSRLPASGGSTQLLIAFTPNAVGDRGATLTIATDSGPIEVRLSGVGQSGKLAVAQSSLDFGSRAVGSAPKSLALSVSNAGNGPLRLSFPLLDGPGVAAFSTALANASGTLVLAEGQKQDVAVTFSPLTAGTLEAVLHLTADTGERLDVALKGQGVSPQLSAPANLDFGAVLLGGFARRTLDLTNPGAFPTTVVGFETPAFGFIAAGNGLPITIAPGATATVGLEFVPTVEGKAATQLSIYIAGQDAAAAQVALTGTATKAKSGGCAGSPASWLALLGVVPLLARRRRAPRA